MGALQAAQIQKVDVGFAHTLVIRNDATVRAWGINSSGQLGDGTTKNSDYPVFVSNLSNVISVAAGHVHSVALLSDGTVWTWGDNSHGQLSQPANVTGSLTPQQVPGLGGVSAIVSGYYHVLALKSDGTVWAWGGNDAGQLGDGSTNDRFSPVQVTGLAGVTDIAVGGEHSYALKSNGTAWTWGANIHFPIESGGMSTTPLQIGSWESKFAKESDATSVPGFAGSAIVVSSPTQTVILQDDGTVLATEGVATVTPTTPDGTPSPVVWSGGVTVQISPAEAAVSGVQWRVDGGEWRSSDAVVSGLTQGSYLVEFRDTYKWAAPVSRNVTISEGQMTTLVADATRKSGDLTVQITPSNAVAAGAQWRIRGGAWRQSGEMIAGLPVDNYVIEFSDLPDWNQPEPKALPLREAGALVAGDYLIKTANLSVQLLPAEVAASGAQWRIVGGEWKNSGDVIADLPVGSHTIEFSTLASWHQPSVNAVNLTPAGVDLTAEYIIKTANLSVQITPADAVAAGAQWRIAGGEWQNSGAVLTGLPVSVYSIEFSNLTDWHTPVSQSVVLTESGLLASADYTIKTGNLSVNLAPADAVVAGAKWRIAGGTWNNSGDVLSDVPVGDYSIEFSGLAAWHTPSAQVATVTETGASLSATYTIKTAGLSVNIEPAEAVVDGAKWRIVGGSWNNSGDVISALPVGDYTIEFLATGDYLAPASVPVTHTETGTSTTATYTIKKSSLTVALLPAEAVTEGAQWSINGTDWYNSSETIADLPVGSYNLVFKETASYAAPAVKSVIVTELAATDSATYTQKTAGLRVQLNAEAVTEGAQWSIAGIDGWHNSGEVVSDLPLGTYTVTFSQVANWVTPSAIEVVVVLTDSGINEAAAEYARQTSAITVNITPAEAAANGAQWRVTGDIWRNSGESVEKPVGSLYTVEFNDVAGWLVPDAITITLGETDEVIEVVYEPAPPGALSEEDMLSALDIDVSGVVKGEILNQEDYVIYSFAAKAGRNYIVSLRSESQTNLQIYAVDGQEVLAMNEGVTHADIARVELMAAQTGRYLVKVSYADSLATGKYHLSVTTRGVAFDFNDDGKSDVVKRDPDTGNSAIEFMDGNTVIGGGVTPWQAGSMSEWSLKAVADFNGDGVSDILWRSKNGKTAMWIMDGLEMGADSGPTSQQIGGASRWAIETTADFDGDGRADILWRHQGTGKLAIWFMNGTEVIEDFIQGESDHKHSGLTSAQVSMSSQWKVVSATDLDGDGFSDILWRHGITGYTAVWYMHGLEVSANSGFTYRGSNTLYESTETLWQIIGTGDFDGDGKHDLLWRNGDTGLLMIWFMDGSQVVNTGYTTDQLVEGTPYVVGNISDYNGDGKADILWCDPDQQHMYVWLMDGLDVMSGLDVNNLNTSWLSSSVVGQ